MNGSVDNATGHRITIHLSLYVGHVIIGLCGRVIDLRYDVVNAVVDNIGKGVIVIRWRGRITIIYEHITAILIASKPISHPSSFGNSMFSCNIGTRVLEFMTNTTEAWSIVVACCLCFDAVVAGFPYLCVFLHHWGGSCLITSEEMKRKENTQKEGERSAGYDNLI